MLYSVTATDEDSDRIATNLEAAGATEILAALVETSPTFAKVAVTGVLDVITGTHRPTPLGDDDIKKSKIRSSSLSLLRR